jgi:hypothetical protein
MTDAKNTPGPWYGKHSVYTDQGLIISEATGETIAVCLTNEADTLLLAAPHDLLAALRELADWPHNSTCFDGTRAKNAAESLANARRRAREAITAATGETWQW